MEGLGTFKGKNHIIIFGWKGIETENIFSEVLADDKWSKKPIVLCSYSLEKFNRKGITFIKGAFHSDDVLKRSGVERAHKILIKGHDSQCISTVIGLMDKGVICDITAYVDTDDAAKTLKKLRCSNLQVIEDLNAELMVQESQDSGVYELLKILLSNKTGPTLYKIHIPEEYSRTWEDTAGYFAHKYNITCLAIGGDELQVTPGLKYVINSRNKFILVISYSRPINLDWQFKEF